MCAPGPAQSANEEIKTAIVQKLISDNLTDTNHWMNSWLFKIVLFPLRLEQGHPNQVIAVQGIARHLPVAWFKDVQGLHGMRKQHQIRQRK